LAKRSNYEASRVTVVVVDLDGIGAAKNPLEGI